MTVNILLRLSENEFSKKYLHKSRKFNEKVRDKTHPIFRREGTNLVYTQKIPLALALVGTTIHVPTLDGRVLDIPITDIVK